MPVAGKRFRCNDGLQQGNAAPSRSRA
jgi:hypothetical protein